MLRFVLVSAIALLPLTAHARWLSVVCDTADVKGLSDADCSGPCRATLSRLSKGDRAWNGAAKLDPKDPLKVASWATDSGDPIVTTVFKDRRVLDTKGSIAARCLKPWADSADKESLEGRISLDWTTLKRMKIFADKLRGKHQRDYLFYRADFVGLVRTYVSRFGEKAFNASPKLAPIRDSGILPPNAPATSTRRHPKPSHSKP